MPFGACGEQSNWLYEIIHGVEAPYPESRGELWRGGQNPRLSQEGGWDKYVTSKRKEKIVPGKVISLRGKSRGFYPADCVLCFAVRDAEVQGCGQTTSLVETRKFLTDWVRLHFWGRSKLQSGQV